MKKVLSIVVALVMILALVPAFTMAAPAEIDVLFAAILAGTAGSDPATITGTVVIPNDGSGNTYISNAAGLAMCVRWADPSADRNALANSLAMGDTVTATGTPGTNSGLPQLFPAALDSKAAGTPLTPTLIALADHQANLSKYIRIEGATIKDLNLGFNTVTMTITDGTVDLSCRTGMLTSAFNAAGYKVGDTVNINGVLTPGSPWVLRQKQVDGGEIEIIPAGGSNITCGCECDDCVDADECDGSLCDADCECDCCEEESDPCLCCTLEGGPLVSFTNALTSNGVALAIGQTSATSFAATVATYTPTGETEPVSLTAGQWHGIAKFDATNYTYVYFTLPTTKGAMDLVFSGDISGNNRVPTEFVVEYKVGGGAWTGFASNSIPVPHAQGVLPAPSITFSFELPEAVEDAEEVSIRIRQNAPATSAADGVSTSDAGNLYIYELTVEGDVTCTCPEGCTCGCGNCDCGSGDGTVWGDADENGVVNAADAAQILRVLVRLAEWKTDQGLINAKVTGNANIGASDAAFILRYLVRLETELNPNERAKK